ncbi:MAG: hypothetical protein IIC66_05590 [candidate division Zixibacteria bacterium]|nr:hypothetical protein [candidate division Zixibacteria bacterium]
MKQKAIIVLSLLALAVSAFALAPLGGKLSQKESLIRDTGTFIDVNQILMFVTNKGSFAYDQGGLLGKNDGLYFPFTSLDDIADQSNNTSVIFAAGIWVGAVDAATGDTLVTIAEYADDWYPGPMIGTTFDPGSEFDVADRVYKLHADSLASNPNTDYTEWPVADGAPVDSLGAPAMLGDQMLWSVYNDANPAPHTNDASSAIGMGLEIRQTTFAFDRTDALANIVFVKYQIYNRGGLTLTDMFVSLWADPDLGNAGDDLVGSDTVLSLGYCYNEGNDSDYGSDPPAVGFDFFQGPLIVTLDNADTAKMWDTTFVGFRNMGMTSFNKYINGTDPQNLTWTYQYMNGLDASIPPGVPLANGTKFYAPGDPTTGVGDLDFAASDRRYMLTTGPFDFAPGDSTEILAAIIVGQGGDRLSSISVLKFNDKFAQQAYDINFDLLQVPAAPEVIVHPLDGSIAMEWTDISEVDPGDYPFQGYSIFQGESPNGPWTRIANFDVIDGAAIIIDEVLDPLTGVIEQRAIKFGSDNGIRHFFSTNADIINGGLLVNNTEYFFRVEAYAYNSSPVATPKTLTSATVIRGIPQGPVVDFEYPFTFGDTLGISHVGVSGGTVTPIVVGPDSLTGDTYRVIFFDTILVTVIDTGMGPETTFTDAVYWNLDNVTQGTSVLTKQFNQTGDDTYPVTDGFVVKVAGPAPGFLSFEVVANGSGPVVPPGAAALNFQGFPTPNDENPGDGADTQPGQWAIHTGDTQPSGSRGSYSAFLSRVFRLSNNDGANLGAYDLEWRFTGSNSSPGVDGGYAWDPFDQGVAIWVPFELWRIGIGTPNDPSDDVRMMPWMIDNTRSGAFELESWGDASTAPQGFVVGDPSTEHSGSGGSNDPFTDWVYWFLPGDDSPGEAGYQEFEDSILADPAGYSGGATSVEYLARTVLISWNGGSAPPFAQDMPEIGTVFRMVTAIPNGPVDTFTFTPPAPTAVTGGAELLENVKVVPNPYYLFSSYDPSRTNRVLKFINLPATCNISIYNLAGDFVVEIVKDDPSTAEATWDVTNNFNVPVASGIYIYVVDAPGFGQKIGKMAIFTEIEILGQY